MFIYALPQSVSAPFPYFCGLPDGLRQQPVAGTHARSLYSHPKQPGVPLSPLSDALYNRYLPQQRYIHLFRQPLGSFFTENIVFILRQFGRCKPSHILYQTEDRHIHFVIGEHIDAFACICQCHSLRCADNDSPVSAKVCTTVK